MPSTDGDNEDLEVLTDGHVITFDLPQIQEDMTLPYVTIRRKRTLNVSLKRRSVIERGDITATWPAFTTKQRLPLPWDSSATPRPATVGRSSSVRFRRSIAATSASNLTLHQTSSNRKSTAKHYIDKKTLTFEIERANTSADWGFSIGGGAFSPYGDLPIFISEISVSGGGPEFLQKGDEIVAFSGDSFEGTTFLEAEKMLRRCKRNRASVTIKRKYLERCQNPQSNPYIEAWSSLNSTKITPVNKQRRRPKSVHYWQITYYCKIWRAVATSAGLFSVTSWEQKHYSDNEPIRMKRKKCSRPRACSNGGSKQRRFQSKNLIGWNRNSLSVVLEKILAKHFVPSPAKTESWKVTREKINK